MKVYMMTDMEGVSGEIDWDMLDWRNEPLHRRGCTLLIGDINAAIQGALDAGADHIVVCDAHAGGGNLKPKDLLFPAKLVYPKGSQNYLPELDETFDHCFLLGTHAMAGTPGGHLAHTQSHGDWESYRINGVERGEITQVAAIAGSKNVPISLVTGASTAIREAQPLLGDSTEYVVVKQDGEIDPVQCLPLPQAHDLIRAAAKRAILAERTPEPFVLKMPARIELVCHTEQYAQEVVQVSGAELTGNRTLTFQAHCQSNVLGRLFDHDRWKQLEP